MPEKSTNDELVNMLSSGIGDTWKNFICDTNYNNTTNRYRSPCATNTRSALKLLWSLSDSRPTTIIRNSKYKHNVDFFSIPNEINSYWAGFIGSDGCIQKNNGSNNSMVLTINLQKKDELHLYKFKNYIEYTGPVHTYVSPQTKKEYSCIRISGATQIARDLCNKFNITEKKSLTLVPPDLSIRNSWSYIIGLFDGDGCYVKYNNSERCNFLGTEKVLSWVKHYVDAYIPMYPKFRGGSNVRKVRHANVYSYDVNGERSKDLQHFMELFDVPKLKRKHIATVDMYRCLKLKQYLEVSN